MRSGRTATRTELDQILRWAGEEGWNPGHDDADAFYAADPEGFFVAADSACTPIAAISVVNHSPEFAFLGLYLVRPASRGQGIGLALWHHALAHAGDRVIGLDGVEDQQANYQASGFVKAGGTTRHSGHIAGAAHAGVREARPEDIPQLIAMEAAASGAHKPAYLNAWFKATPSRTTLVAEIAGQIHGMCTLRTCQDGAKIGPLIAPDAATCVRLLEHAAHLVPGPVVVDVPDVAQPLAAVCASYGMAPSFKTARMYRGPAPVSTAPTDFFAVVSLELG